MRMTRHWADVLATDASEWEHSSSSVGIAGRSASVVPASEATKETNCPCLLALRIFCKKL